MKLQQKIHNKFSIVLATAIVFIALTVVATAQGKKVTIDFCKTDKTYAGGIFMAASNLNSDETATNRIDVSRISLLTGAFDGGAGVVDSCDADAASKIKMLFDVRRNLRLTNNIVIEVPENDTPEWFQMTNYLRQAQTSRTPIPVLQIIINEDETRLEIEMKDVYFTSYQTGGSSGDDVPTNQLSLNFAAIKFEYKPQNDKD